MPFRCRGVQRKRSFEVYIESNGIMIMKRLSKAFCCLTFCQIMIMVCLLCSCEEQKRSPKEKMIDLGLDISRPKNIDPKIFGYRKNIDIQELEDLDIYPAIKDVLDKDQQVHPRLLDMLKEPGWKHQRIGQISYFYLMEEERFLAFAEEIRNEMKKVQPILRLSDDDVEGFRLTYFLFSTELWDQLTSLGNAFYLNGTSQIYINKTESKNCLSHFSHEFMHYSLHKVWPDAVIPLWLDEGLAQIMERPYYLRRNHGRFALDLMSATEKDVFIPLEILTTQRYFTPNIATFYFESYYFVKYLDRRIGRDRLYDFVDAYLKEDFPGIDDLKRAFNHIEGGHVSLQDLEKGFLEFLTKKSNKVIELHEDLQLDFENERYDFGKVKKGTLLEHRFVGTNTTDFVIDIEDIQLSCGCTAAKISRWSIPPGETTQIQIILDTESKMGDVEERVRFYLFSDEKESWQILSIRAQVE